MPTTSVGINSQNAGLFSAAAYPDFTGNLPPGWNSVPLSNNSAGVDSFSVFVNPDTQQAVIAFKGTNTPTQAYNDVTSTGAQDYYNIRTLAQTALRKIQSDYSGYQVFTDGHSLGGGMAQSFALENGLSGFGQNSLPVASGTAADPRIFPSTADFNTALQNYRAGLTQDSSGNTAHFNEVNVSGDPATLAYSGGTYLDTSPTTLSSSYSIIEKAGALISRISSAAALGLEAWAMSQAHSIDTVNSLTNANGNQASQTNSSGSVTTQYGDGSASTKVINPVDGSSIVSTVYPNGNASVITYDANQNVTNALIRTFNPTDGTSSAAITDINGTASNTNYDANQQIITTSTVNTATNSGTTQNYTNGVLTSKTDFGAISATTTSYDPVLHVVTGVETVNSDSTASSVKYDPRSGNTIYSSIRDTTGAITTAATNDDGSVTTKHPNGAVSNTTINGAGLPTVYTNNPDGSVSVVAYAELGTPVSMPNGTLSNMTEQTGKVSYSALINLDGSSSSVKYDTDGSATLIQRNADGSGSSMTLHPDGSLNQEIVTQADGTQNTTNYGANNVVSSTAASFLDGSAIVNTFNDNGTPKQQWFTQTDGTVTTTSYGADGLGSTVVQKADGSGCITGYNLDGTSYAKVINTDGSSTTSTWDTLGNLVSEQFVGVTSKSVTYEYVSSSTTFNGSTSTTIITDPFGNVTTTTENHSGIATVCFIPYSSHQTVTNSDGTQISTWYLLDGKVGTKNITYSDGSSLNTVYDQNGNSGIVVATNADGSGNETVVGPNGYSVDFGPGQSPFYLPGRNFISTGEMVQNVYDGRGGLISRAVRYPSGTTLSTSYHTNGRLSSVNISNPNGTLQQTGFNENIYGYLTSPFFTRNWQSPYTLSSMAAYSASYYENGECSSRSISLLDGSSATMSYYFNGVNQSEIVISADGAKGSVYFYSNGQVKDLTHFHADGSVIDSKCYYSDGQLLFKSSYLQDGSLLTERYFSNGLKSSSSWTGRADGASVVYVGYVDGSFSETTYSADGSHVKTTQNSQGDVTTCNFDANGIKLSDSWSKSSGMSGVNSFSADGSSTGTTVFQNGWHSKYTNDGHGDIVTSTFDLNNIQLSSVRSKVDGSSGTDLFNTDGSGSGAAQFANGNNYSYVKNVRFPRYFVFQGSGFMLPVSRSAEQ
jgi:antitoxin component YwqK of YwqJK toxin-antitoxin module